MSTDVEYLMNAPIYVLDAVYSALLDHTARAAREGVSRANELAELRAAYETRKPELLKSHRASLSR